MKDINKIYRMNERNIQYYLDSSSKINPKRQSFKVASVYAIVGIIWIVTSDNLAVYVAGRDNLYEQIQTYKGWVFVLLTTLVIYISIRNSLMLFDKALNEIYQNYDELNKSHETLLELEGEIERQLQDLHILAYYDTFTKLPNKHLLEKEIKNLINSSKIESLTNKFAFICLTIDNLADINDILGHKYGDLLIKNVGNTLKDIINNPNKISKLKEDMFAIILLNIKDKNEVVDKVNNILLKLKRGWKINNQEFHISYNLGISLYPIDGSNFNDLLKNSNMALSKVKSLEKDKVSFYDKTIEERNVVKINLINEIIHAIENEQFSLFYQPIVDLKKNVVIGVEALIRWIHPKKGFVSPMDFVPLAESMGLIDNIEKWVFKQALMQKKSWNEKGYKSIKISINLSSKRMNNDCFIDELCSMTNSMEIDREEVQLEITETSVIDNLEIAGIMLNKLRSMGFKIALDDFGTGYSSLTYINSLSMDVVKIDKEFIKSISNKNKNAIIVTAVMNLIHSLDLVVVAEGIENIEQKEFLKLNGCDMGQGFLYSKALPAVEVEKLFTIKFE
ncbi:GGDEF domain-containing protein [Clostridium sp. YIM B02505]|uniref:GGDEF domain-containing protein n=1 Tax=Clostridium yunnanense TaxID=2800325 RepID=A0ABS1EUC5_9CLOT|nr:bifunctional diguanylate cyclase/phosphodiesterase [Clostridium yunnanense]MBK1812981.1 GGDEF domain-containing protein [Clostridium yunnanense]